MGYCGLECAAASDTACDFFCNVALSVTEALKKEAKKENGPYNTDGCVNAAFFISEVLYPASVHASKYDLATSFFTEELLDSIKEVKKGLENKIKGCDETQKEEWDDEENRISHYSGYKELMEDINNTIDIVTDINTYD